MLHSHFSFFFFYLHYDSVLFVLSTWCFCHWGTTLYHWFCPVAEGNTGRRWACLSSWFFYDWGHIDHFWWRYTDQTRPAGACTKGKARLKVIGRHLYLGALLKRNKECILKGPRTTQRAKCGCGVAIVCNKHVAVRTHPNYQIFRINERLLYFI